MLGHFLDTAGPTLPIALAHVSTPRLRKIIPQSVRAITLADNQKFSLFSLIRQIRSALTALRQQNIAPAAIHGWTARDWELTAGLSLCLRVPGIGSLHDHPRAEFISRSRQRLMRLAAFCGISRIVCVSEAVRTACVEVGFPPGQLACIHNGLPHAEVPLITHASPSIPIRIGYLGALSSRKGLDALFIALNNMQTDSWNLTIAGAPMDKDGKEWLEVLKNRFRCSPWWSKVLWLGWIADSSRFFQNIDLLVLPSAQFDPFPTVLLEAARAGVPVLAANVGGVSEMLTHEETGWIIEPTNWSQDAAIQLDRIVSKPNSLAIIGHAAKLRFQKDFTINKMVGRYAELYESLISP